MENIIIAVCITNTIFLGLLAWILNELVGLVFAIIDKIKLDQKINKSANALVIAVGKAILEKENNDE